MKYLLNLLILIIFASCQQDEKNKNIDKPNENKSEKLGVLLIGTFHFANFNPENNGDIIEVNVPDVLTAENQKELKNIANAIKIFNPDKIFLEYPFASQTTLDKIYASFNITNFSKAKRNEIPQIGFRVAKLLNHNKIYAMDVRTDFPFDSLILEMEKAKQFDLLEMLDSLFTKLFSKSINIPIPVCSISTSLKKSTCSHKNSASFLPSKIKAKMSSVNFDVIVFYKFLKPL
jgi:hypothetical protein